MNGSTRNIDFFRRKASLLVFFSSFAHLTVNMVNVRYLLFILLPEEKSSSEECNKNVSK